MIVKILAKDNDKPGNIELVEYLKVNLIKLLSKKFEFKFQIVEDKDRDELVKNNITGLPAAIIGKKVVVGSEEIIRVLSGYNTHVKKSLDPDESMREYYESEMTLEKAMADANEAEDGDEKTKILSKVNEEMERRNKEDKSRPAVSRRDNLPSPSVSLPPKNRHETNKDDDLLERMMETTN